jgi:hypothetical protein
MIFACRRIAEEVQRHYEGTLPAWPLVQEGAFLELLCALQGPAGQE